MNLHEIKRAVESGKTVHWASRGYRVIKDSAGQWLIKCDFNDTYIGLTWRDGVTVNGKPEQFFIDHDPVFGKAIDMMLDRISDEVQAVTHTPRPLAGAWWQDPNDNRIHDSTGNDVLDYLPVTEIGRRVNSHDALVAALEAVRDSGMFDWEGGVAYEAEAKQVADALALAQEVQA